MEEWRIPVALPFASAPLIDYLRRRRIPGVDQFAGLRYQRVLEVDGSVMDVELDMTGAETSGYAMVRATCGRALVTAVSTRAERLLDASWDPDPANAVLSQDAALAELVALRPGLRVPGTMAPYELAVRSIVGQQISVRAATTVTGRIARRFGRAVGSSFEGLERTFPSPATLATADLEGCGLPASRASAIRTLSARVSDGRLVLEQPVAGRTIGGLREIRGIGPWTSEYVSLRGLGRRDSIPVADLGLRAALALRIGTPVSAPELSQRSEGWRPYRGLAAVHLWTTLFVGDCGGA